MGSRMGGGGKKQSASTSYTLTFAAVSSTHPNPTSSVVATTAATNVTPYGFSQAQANALPVAVNAVAADLLEVKKVLNQVITDLRTAGVLP